MPAFQSCATAGARSRGVVLLRSSVQANALETDRLRWHEVVLPSAAERAPVQLAIAIGTATPADQLCDARLSFLIDPEGGFGDCQPSSYAFYSVPTASGSV